MPHDDYKDLEVLYTRQQIAERVEEMGAQITRDLAGEKLVMIGVLKARRHFGRSGAGRAGRGNL